MATSSFDSIFALQTSRVVLATGASILIEPVAFQNFLQMKVALGGSLELVGVAQGATLSSAQLTAAAGQNYALATNDVLSVEGPVRFYLISPGSTSEIQFIRGLSQNAPVTNQINAPTPL